MTRPIFEPTPARADARLGFDRNQLQRRPAPTTSPFTIDSAFANDSTVSGGTTTVVSGGTHSITFDEISIAAGSTAFAVRTAVPSFRPIKVTLDAWYLFYLNFEWSGGTYTDERTYSLFINNLADNAGAQDIVQTQQAPNINAAFNATYGPFYMRGASLSDSYYSLDVSQNSGTTQTITGVLLTAICLGGDLDPARMPPF
jgi:hypothetical protein